MHALIETDTLTDRGNRKDFGGETPPDLSHKSPPLKWVPVVKAADPAYDPLTHKLQKAADVITLTELTQGKEAVALSPEAAAAAQRTADRDAMAAQWKTQVPASIRPHYEHLYRVVNLFLDEGDDAAAELIVSEADPIAAIANDAGRLAQFNSVKSQFVAAIQALSA